MRTTLSLVAVALVCGCGGSPKPVPVPSPPVVQVIPAASVVVDTQFVVDVQTSSCDALKSVELDDGTRPLARVDSPSGTRVSFTVSRTGLDYARDGIEAHLDLHATAVCNNGAQDTSHGVGMVFMPAAQSFPGTLPLSGLNLDASGRSVIGCVGTSVERLGVDGAVMQSTGTSLGFNCTASGYLLRGGADELYWIEPGQNVARMSGSLRVTPGAVYNESVGAAFLGPSGGPAVFFTRDASGMFWIDRATGQRLTPRLSLGGSIAGSSALASGTLLVPESSQPLGTSKVNLQVERWNTSTATSSGIAVLANVPVGALGTANVPPLNLSPDGSRAYFIAGASFNELWACDSDKPCFDRAQGGGLIFKASVTAGVFTIGAEVGSSVIAAGPGGVQFFDSSGQAMGQPIAPSGGLQILSVLPGVGGGFYILGGDTVGNLLEVILLAGPGVEAARFHVDTGAIGFDTDAAGAPYLLVNGHLAQLLSADQYRLARP
jgi:hypothetical protein